jgi:hypothetical protein
MSTSSNVPFIGLVFLVIGFIGFIVMAIGLDAYSELFAMIICWYVIIISCAVAALGKDFQHSRRFHSSLDQKTRAKPRTAGG